MNLYAAGTVLLLCTLSSVAASSQQVAPELDSERGTANASVRLAPSIQLSYTSGPHEFHLRGSSTEVVHQVLGAFAITAVANLAGSAPIRFDTEAIDYPVAADLLRLATDTLIVPLDSNHVLVVPDSKENREHLLRMATEVLYLPALSATEMQDVVNLAKSVFDVRQVSLQPASNTVLVRATENTLLALNQILVDLWGGQSQIALDISLYQTERSRTVSVGLQLPQSSTLFNVDSELDAAIKENQSAVNEIVSSGLASADDTVAIVAILVEEGLVTGVLSDPFALFGGGISETGMTFGTLTANLSLSASETRELQHALIRAAENEPATLKVGSRYPIETASYTGAYYTSSGKVSSSTTPEISYQDIGLNLKVTPRPESGGRIHLAIEMNLQSLEGQSINGLPVLTSRSLTTQTALREGAAAVLSSVLTKSATGSLDQVPGLAGAGTNQSGQDSVSELAIVITPHLLRKKHEQASSPVLMLPVHD
jgi:type II secretory pathway component GspD/PulD (secretin)